MQWYNVCNVIELATRLQMQTGTVFLRYLLQEKQELNAGNKGVFEMCLCVPFCQCLENHVAA